MTNIASHRPEKGVAVVPENVTQRLAEHVRAWGWGDLVAFQVGDRAWTFAEVFEGAARVAKGYRDAKLRPGERGRSGSR